MRLSPVFNKMPARRNKNMMKNEQERRSALAGWDNEGGASPSDGDPKADAGRHRSAEQASRATLDTAYDSSARGEHRYSGAHQTDAEQKARRDRDALRTKLEGTR
jgi:hypothetical protein